MSNLKLGFPRMHVEAGEKRDFTPTLMKRLTGYDGLSLLLEPGYGEKLGFTGDDYLSAHSGVSFVDRKEVLSADLVTIIRTPASEDLMLMRPGSALFSMLHYPTHDIRNQLMASRGIRGVSMDGATDDFGVRYIQDFRGTARNAMQAGFRLWFNQCGNIHRSRIGVTILGTGGLGRIAADEAVHYGGIVAPEAAPVVVAMAGRSVTADPVLMQEILSRTDILVDATLRLQTGRVIVPNQWLVHLPEDAVIVDITADDYDTLREPIQVKGIEGIPTGNLDQTIFLPDDPAWDSVPTEVDKRVRRSVVSCYSWPAINPLLCVEKYENQMLPLLDLLIRNHGGRFNPESNNPYERAISRSLLDVYLQGVERKQVITDQ
jgi:alanine dehydrogenase